MNGRDDSIPFDAHFQPDSRLDALLDQALSPASVPGGVPAHLSQAILAKTQRAQARLHTSIVARIDRYPWLRALAASVVCSVGLGILLAGSGIVHDSHNLLALNRDLGNVRLMTPVMPTPEVKTVAVDDASAMGKTLDDVEQDIEQELGSLPKPDDDPDGTVF